MSTLTTERIEIKADREQIRRPHEAKTRGPASVTQDIQGIQISKDIQDSQRDTTTATASVAAVFPSKEEEDAAWWKGIVRRRSEYFERILKLPFYDFLCAACHFAWESADSAGFDADRGDDFCGPLFYFVWLVRGHEVVKPMLDNAKKALKEIEPCICNWSKLARRERREPRFGSFTGDCWEEWFAIEKPDARAAFIDLWDRMRFLPGASPLTQAIAANRCMRLLLSQDHKARRPVGDEPRCEDDYEFFIGVAGHLQSIMGDREILLPCREVGELMNVSAMTISRYRRWAVEDRLLVVTRECRFRPNSKQNDATQFRFDVSRWPAIRDKAQKGTEASFAAYVGA